MADLAIDVVKAIAELVGAQAWKNISLAWGFQDHLEKLRGKFLDTQELLEDVGSAKDAEKKHLVNRWLDQVKDVSYLADDVMDDYAYEILRRKLELGKNIFCKKIVCNIFTPTNNPIVFRVRMTHKVLEILSKFDELDKEATRIGLKQVKITSQSDGAKRTNLDQIRENALASASKFTGREADKKKVTRNDVQY